MTNYIDICNFKLDRYFINSPSIFQPDNKYHGRKVLALRDLRDFDFVDVYFADGIEVSIRIHKMFLSKGWPK